MIKTSGAEFKAFYDDPEFWPADVWHECEYVTINGYEWDEEDVQRIPDDALVTLADGIVYCGNKPLPTFEAYFRRWLKKQTTAVMVVECPIAKADDLRAAIKAAGGRVR